MVKKSVDEVICQWNQRMKDSRGSLEGVMWLGLPIWNKYVDDLQMHHLRRILKQIKPSEKVLELGCGIGRFSFRLGKLCKEAYAIDGSEEAIKICKKKSEENNISNIRFKVMDLRKLDFDNETFDWVLSVTSIEHITNEPELCVAIREALRVTKRSGKVILLECTSDKRNDEYVIALPRNRWFENIEKAGGIIEDWSVIDISFLRKIFYRAVNLMRRTRLEKVKSIKLLMEFSLIFLIRPFEYYFPNFLKNQAWYTLAILRNKYITEEKSD